jgi:hypothetical protein
LHGISWSLAALSMVVDLTAEFLVPLHRGIDGLIVTGTEGR